ncbi:MAG: C10 family peptidase [Prevotella sp.]|nr:C10 family peptidase [Prevotella sp.]
MNKFFAVVAFLACTTIAFAKPLSERAALGNAKIFLKQHLANRVGQKLTVAYKGRKAGDQEPRLYVCNMGDNEGFVILSGDDRTVPVLAYSDTGSFDADNMPPNMQWWMDYYEEAVAQVADMQLTNQAPTARPTDVISPLITTKWDQMDPYNQQCPRVNGSLPPTGCVATALAQLMYYHKWPADSTKAIDGYTTYSYKVEVEKLQPTAFKWDDMLRSYGRNATQKQKDAVAELMRYCGQLVQMDYTPASSGASTSFLGWVLPQYFNYPNTIHEVSRDGYSIEQWDSILVNELKNKRPVLYTGYTMAYEGHAFLCDGYDGKGFYHINWGWSGNGDAHYRISVLDANTSGTGGSATSMRFSVMQSALIGVKTSGEDEYKAPEKTLSVCARPSLKFGRTYTRTGASTDFKGITVELSFINMGEREENFYLGLALYDSTGTYLKTLKSTSRSFWPGYGDDVEFNFNVGKDIEEGEYSIMPVFRKGSMGNMQTVFNADKNHLEILIKGDTMLVTPVPKADFVVNSVRKDGQNIVVNLTNNDEEFNGFLAARKLNNKGEVEDVAYEPAAILPSTTRSICLYIDDNHSLDLQNDVFFLSVDSYPEQYFYSNATNEGADMEGSLDILNYSEDSTAVVGDKVMCRVKLNNSGEGSYRHVLALSMVDEQGEEVAQSSLVNIGGRDSMEYVAQLKPSVFDKKYKVVLKTYKGKKLTSLCETPMLDVVKGAVYWTAEGRLMTKTAAQVFEVPQEAVAVNVRMAYTKNVTPNDNPNTIYMLDKNVPKGLSGKNNFNFENKGGYANIHDGYDCFFPQDLFVTAAARFSRTFQPDEVGKWSTINLPFEPKTITADGVEVDWFRQGDDNGKGFYLQTIKEVKNGILSLDYADQFLPFTTYFISISPELAGKTLVFESGKETSLKADFAKDMVVTLDDCTILTPSIWTTPEKLASFIPVSAPPCSVFALDGDRFTAVADDTPLAPFRAYILTDTPVAQDAVISIEGPMLPDGISTVTMSDSRPASGYTVHDVTGRLVGSFRHLSTLPPGIYIVNGKKVVVP